MIVLLLFINLLMISDIIILLVSTALVAFMFTSLAIAATIQGGFVVNNISVDIIATSPAEARRHAFIKAKAEAVWQLLKHLTTPATQILLPVSIDDNVLNELVQEVVIEEEKNTTTHYMANLSIHFRPTAVRTYLKTLNVPYDWPQPNTDLLIIPTFQESISVPPSLCSKDNPWKTAWQRIDTGRLMPIVVYSCDPIEQQILLLSQTAVDPVALIEAIVSHHGTGRAMVVNVTVLSTGENGLLPTVEVRVLETGNILSPLLTNYVVGTPGDTVPILLDRAAQIVLERLELNWRKQQLEKMIQTVIKQGQEQELTLMVPVTSLAEWLEIKQKLKHVHLIVHTDIQAMTRTLIQLYLRYYGEEIQLSTSLVQYGLKIIGYGPVRRLVRITTDSGYSKGVEQVTRYDGVDARPQYDS